MLQQSTVQLRFGDHELGLPLEDASSTPSVSTGRQLVTGSVSFSAPKGTLSPLVEGLLKDAASGSVPLAGAIEGTPRKFKVGPWSSTTHDGAANVEYRVELHEVEEVTTPTLLIVNGIDTQPHHYEERIQENGISISCRVKVSPEVAEQLWQMWISGEPPNYFPVVRQGISDEPRQMRFGRCTWSEHEDGVKYELVLVDRTVDESGEPFRGFNEPELSNVMSMAASTTALVAALLDELGATALLTDEQIARVREKAQEGYSRRAREFFRVNDVDL
jgi:hypothetical protein